MQTMDLWSFAQSHLLQPTLGLKIITWLHSFSQSIRTLRTHLSFSEACCCWSSLCLACQCRATSSTLFMLYSGIARAEWSHLSCKCPSRLRGSFHHICLAGTDCLLRELMITLKFEVLKQKTLVLKCTLAKNYCYTTVTLKCNSSV